MYHCAASGNYLMVYVDDSVIMGPEPDRRLELVATKVLLRDVGELRSGTTVRFLGRRLRHVGQTTQILSAVDYITDTLKENGFTNTNCVNSPVASQRQTTDGVSTLTPEGTRRYRRSVVRLTWLMSIRPDINCAVKELSRSKQVPIEGGCARLKQPSRYLKGTEVCAITPHTQTNPNSMVDVTCFVDSDWAGRLTTRKSTSGAVITLRGTAVHHYSRTQGTVATSSGEAELYALASGTLETAGIANFLRESRLVHKVNLRVHTDSSSAKAIASRVGLSKLTKHIQPRHVLFKIWSKLEPWQSSRCKKRIQQRYSLSTSPSLLWTTTCTNSALVGRTPTQGQVLRQDRSLQRRADLRIGNRRDFDAQPSTLTCLNYATAKMILR